MRYVDFRDTIHKELKKNPGGLTWKDLKNRLDLPYESPCQTWLRQLENEIGLVRRAGSGRALLWTIKVADHTE